MPHWTVDIRSLHLAVETVMRYRRISAREAAQEIGVPASTLSRLKDGLSLSVDAFASIVAWLRADPGRFFLRVDGGGDLAEDGSGDDDRVLVSREDALIAWSWATEALAGLPESLRPMEDRTEVVSAALQRLQEEVGYGPARESSPGEPSSALGDAYCSPPESRSVQG